MNSDTDKLAAVEAAIAKCDSSWATFIESDDDSLDETIAAEEYEKYTTQLHDLLKSGELLAELRARRLDSARLDWLEKHLKTVAYMRDIGGDRVEMRSCDGALQFPAVWNFTLRETTDEAMKATMTLGGPHADH